MPDQIITASAPDAGFAIIAGITTELVRETQERHQLSPTASAAVGRLVTGAALLGTNLKGSERISLQIQGDGPIAGITADAWLLTPDSVGARGYAKNGDVDIPLNNRGKFDVARAIGKGALQVTKSYEVGQPYAGVVPLYSGEIAEDIASYLVNSEQIPSVVALGVLANPEGIVAAGGVIAQVLPGAHKQAVAGLEQRALAMPPVTTLISKGATAHDLLHALAGDAQLRAHRTLDIRFACRCTREKVEAALLGLGVDQLRISARERAETEATCEFCKKVYVFSSEEIDGLAARIEKAG
ncbi:MAG: Hsp33 family molecular chaperone HslO [Candidatus Eremiobacteraeota bacterium]|nr:Hsp33 family molecular chaperone HslO [Candidatus Eremiobacteraeota bacterium]